MFHFRELAQHLKLRGRNIFEEVNIHKFLKWKLFGQDRDTFYWWLNNWDGERCHLAPWLINPEIFWNFRYFWDCWDIFSEIYIFLLNFQIIIQMIFIILRTLFFIIVVSNFSYQNSTSHKLFFFNSHFQREKVYGIFILPGIFFGSKQVFSTIWISNAWLEDWVNFIRKLIILKIVFHTQPMEFWKILVSAGQPNSFFWSGMPTAGIHPWNQEFFTILKYQG